MITLLSKLFIKDYTSYKEPAVRQRYGVLCGICGIVFNLLLFVFKYAAGFLSHSIAITADAFNNLSDAGSSLITLIGFKMAGQKPDISHPFGNGRIEYLSGLSVSIAILIMAFELIKSSIDKMIHPVEVETSMLTIIILVVSILVKLYMSFYNKRIGKKISSAAMKATATDSLSDTLSTTVVLIAALVNHFFGLKVDAYCGILVGIFILYAGISALRDTINPLLGQAPDKEFVDNIESIVMAHNEVIGIHDLIVHDYGPGRVMISLHAEVPSTGNIMTLHDSIDNIETELRKKLHCDAVIHMDPVAVNDPTTDFLKQETLACLHEIDEALPMHDFRIVKGPTHTNIIFDIVVPYKYKYSDEELSALINKKINEKMPNHYVVINIDKAYC